MIKMEFKRLKYCFAPDTWNMFFVTAKLFYFDILKKLYVDNIIYIYGRFTFFLHLSNCDETTRQGTFCLDGSQVGTSSASTNPIEL